MARLGSLECWDSIDVLFVMLNGCDCCDLDGQVRGVAHSIQFALWRRYREWRSRHHFVQHCAQVLLFGWGYWNHLDCTFLDPRWLPTVRIRFDRNWSRLWHHCLGYVQKYALPNNKRHRRMPCHLHHCIHGLCDSRTLCLLRNYCPAHLRCYHGSLRLVQFVCSGTARILLGFLDYWPTDAGFHLQLPRYFLLLLRQPWLVPISHPCHARYRHSWSFRRYRWPHRSSQALWIWLWNSDERSFLHGLCWFDPRSHCLRSCLKNWWWRCSA